MAGVGVSTAFFPGLYWLKKLGLTPRPDSLPLVFIFLQISSKQLLRGVFNRVAVNQVSIRDELREIRGELVRRERGKVMRDTWNVECAEEEGDPEPEHHSD